MTSSAISIGARNKAAGEVVVIDNSDVQLGFYDFAAKTFVVDPTAANAVKVTLGPKGRNVIIDKKFGAPIITKDGVTVAKEIELEDPIENMGAQMVKEVASKTSDVAGDGTTTATVLAQAIIIPGLKSLAAGANPMDLKRGIDKAVKVVIANIIEQSENVGKDIKKIEQVGTSSRAEDDTGAKFAFDFTARNRRPPRDPINALLSLAYSEPLKADATNSPS